MEQTGFLSTRNKGFRMHFDNGFEISVQWGVGNYCENQDKGSIDESTKHDFWGSCSAEIAIFDTNNRKQESSDVGMISLGRDTVDGWVSADHVAKVIAIVQSVKTVKEIQRKYKNLKIKELNI